MSDKGRRVVGDDLVAPGLFNGPGDSAQPEAPRPAATSDEALFPGPADADAPAVDSAVEAYHLFDEPDQVDENQLDVDTELIGFGPADAEVHSDPVAVAVAVGDVIAERSEQTRQGRKRRRRIILVSAAAVLVLGVAGGVTAYALAVQRAAEAAEAAMVQLGREEHALSNQINQVNQSIEALETDLTAAAGFAQSFAQPLASMAGASDETVRAATEAARAEYAQTVAQITVPEKHSTYRRDDIDTGAVESIEGAQAEVTHLEGEVSKLSSSVAQARSGLAQAGETFTAAMSAFRATFPAFAETLVAENADADESFHTAVRNSAAAVAATADTATTRGTVWNQYIADVAALRSDQVRATEERERNEQNNRINNQNYSNSNNQNNNNQNNNNQNSNNQNNNPQPPQPDPVEPQPDPVEPQPPAPDPEPVP